MKCSKCNNDNQENAKFCMRCGAAMETEKIPAEMKAKTKRNISVQWGGFVLIVAALLSFVIIGAAKYRRANSTAMESGWEQVYNDYVQINEKAINIEKKYAIDGFVQPEDIPALLDEIEVLAKEYKSEGLISYYDKQSDNIFFKLNNGVGYLYAPTVEGMLAGEELGKILTIEPYTTDPKFIVHYLTGGKSPDKAAENIVEKLPENYSFSENDNWDSLSLEQIEQMGDHKIIIWYGHGNYVNEYGPVLGSSIPITDAYTMLRYQFELLNGEMMVGKEEFFITPAYFDNLEDNSLDGSLVFLNTCKSAMDDRLAEVFINKGASLVVGNSHKIFIRYSLYMMDDFMSALTNQYDDGTYWTAEDALAYAKSQNGESDSEFWCYGAEVKLIYPENESGYRLYYEDNQSNIEKLYKQVLQTYPEATFLTNEYQVETEYVLYDIDKNGVRELIVRENLSKFYIYTIEDSAPRLCGEFHWCYSDCLYAYDGNGLVVHDGGMGSMHLEYVDLYVLSEDSLERTNTIISTEAVAEDVLIECLDRYTPIDGFIPITDFSLIENG